jgi:hypothetical protein
MSSERRMAHQLQASVACLCLMAGLVIEREILTEARFDCPARGHRV